MSNINFRYQFDEFSLLTNEKLLLRNNEIIALSCRAFDVLLLLIENRGKVLLKQELLDRVWTDKFVEEGNLAVAVNSLRNALKTKPEKNYIQTFPKRGYRFNADVIKVFVEAEIAVKTDAIKENEQPFSDFSNIPVHPEFPSVSGPRSSEKPAQPFLSRIDNGKWLLILILLIILSFAFTLFLFSSRALAQTNRQNSAVSQKSKLVILPFVNLNSEAANQTSSVDLTNSIKNELIQTGDFSGIRIAESSDYSELQKNNEAEYILAGTYQQDGEKIEVETQLIEVKTGKTLINNKENFLSGQQEQFIKKIGFKIKLHSNLMTTFLGKNH